MNNFYIAAIAIAVIGALFIPYRYFTASLGHRGAFRGGGSRDTGDASGFVIIKIFAVVVLLFGAFSAYWYRAVILANQELIFYAAWLVVVMIFGMFVQVLATAYRENKSFRIRAADLVLPLLFSIVVFYPIWAIATTAAKSFSSFMQRS